MAVSFASNGAVYPRAYGGTGTQQSRRTAAIGLSPRVRGNPSGTISRIIRRRSIPARTGEPASRYAPPAWTVVYPRAYGGTCWWPPLAH